MKKILALALTLGTVLSPATYGQNFTGPATITQPTTAGHCVKIGTQGANNLADAGAACAGGSGTVTSVTGTANQINVANGTTTPALTLSSTIVTPGTFAISAGSPITSSGPGGALGSNAFTSTAFAPLASPTFTGTVTVPNGASLGTPSALVLTNATGLPNAGLVNSSITLGTTATSLGGTSTSVTGLSIAAGSSNTLGASSLVLGGATIGGNALAVTGTSLFNGNLAMNATGAAQLQNSAASATAPSVLPNKSSSAAGIGADVAGDVSIINNSLENARFANAAASASALDFVGTVFTGGTGTTTFPQLLFQPTGTTAATSWSTSGTALGMNLATGFSGNMVDLRIGGGGSLFKIDSSGSVTASGNISASTTNQLGFNGRSTISSPSDGILRLVNNASTGFTRIDLGGTTSSFGGLQTNGTETDSELADGSALAPFGASTYKAAGNAGVACSGTPSASFASVGGIVTHC